MAADLPATLTIGRLARSAGVGVETVRYYQQRELLPVPQRTDGFRHYPAALVDRIRFIKRAQELGFTLEEIAGLLSLQDGTDRSSIRRITTARLDQVRSRLADLARMRRTLEHLLHECESGASNAPCPIIATLARGTTVGETAAAPARASRRDGSGARRVRGTSERSSPSRRG